MNDMFYTKEDSGAKTLYKVYVKTNNKGVIIAINSSAFLPKVIVEADKWIEIDGGTDDKYCHAQGNYLSEPLIDNNGIYNYILIDNVPTLRTVEDKQPEIDEVNAQMEIIQLKARLVATDYIAAKLAEGAADRDEYSEELAQRAQWRNRINELEQLYN